MKSKKLDSNCFVKAAELINNNDRYNRNMFTYNVLGNILGFEKIPNCKNLLFVHYCNMFNTQIMFDFQWQSLYGFLPEFSELEEPRKLALLLAKAAWDAGDKFC